MALAVRALPPARTGARQRRPVPDAGEALAALERVRAGDFAVECAVTLLQSNNTRMGRFMDQHPSGSLVLAAGTGAAVLLGLAGWVAFALS
ncbi:MAG: hypothetical protein JKY37_33195 [Nannocystaceae bacterium]|nr:hypothetical protein [Nannocystaceae bacterium]